MRPFSASPKIATTVDRSAWLQAASAHHASSAILVFSHSLGQKQALAAGGIFEALRCDATAFDMLPGSVAEW